MSDKRIYLFFDEIQRVPGWENAINAFRVDFDCDIYVTGSNAYMLSSEYATYLAGRCIEIKMLPLSFSEFLDFHDLKVVEKQTTFETQRIQVVDTEGTFFDIEEAFEAYLRFGGMPGVADIGFDQEKAFMLLDGIYSTVVLREIIARENLRGQKKINDPILLKKIILFLADNVGNSVSVSKIGNTLAHEGLLDEERKTKPSTHTTQAYIQTLLESYFFYDIKRFDIKGKEYLRTLGKYYIVDIGLRNYLLGLRDRDRGHVLENIVYLELLRRGYDVAIGKVGQSEIDFIATKIDEKLYIQVTESMLSEEVRKRELAPLLKIKDNYPKIVLNMDSSTETYEGIQSINLIVWLLDTNY